MQKFIKRAYFPSKREYFLRIPISSTIFLQKQLYLPFPLVSQPYHKNFSSAFEMKESNYIDPDSDFDSTLKWPWMFLDDSDKKVQLTKSEKLEQEKLPDVSNEGFISKKEFNPANGLNMFEKVPDQSEELFFPEGILYEEYQYLF